MSLSIRNTVKDSNAYTTIQWIYDDLILSGKRKKAEMFRGEALQCKSFMELHEVIRKYRPRHQLFDMFNILKGGRT